MSSQILSDMWVLGVPVAEKILRPLVVYVFLIAGLRLAGKRELAQLNPFDLVVLLTLSNTVQNAIIGSDNSVTGGIIGAVTLLMANHYLVRLTYRHQKLYELVEGRPTVLIDRGVVQQNLLAAELITRAELDAAALEQGFESLEAVERAVLDPGGGISFFARKPTAEEVRHREVLAELRRLSTEIAARR